MIYDLLAGIYDEVNKDIDYVAWADFIEKIMKKDYPRDAELVLDLGCGTGSMTIELAKRGYDMTGVDLSVEMLDIARTRAYEQGLGLDILWLNQDMCEFELYGTVDIIVSCLDCVNHITTPSRLKKCFSLVHNYLMPDGLFIFDINGKAKFENVYGQKNYVMETENSFCSWQNFYNSKTKLCDFYITLFSENEDGSYARYDDVQKEKMYTVELIKKYLKEQGLLPIGIYSDFEFGAATDEDERIYVVARCIK